MKHKYVTMGTLQLSENRPLQLLPPARSGGRMRPIRAVRSLCSLPARWTKRAAKELGGRDPAALLTKHTAEGIAVKPLYMSSDLPAPPPDGETARWKCPPWQCPNLARAPPRAPCCSGLLGAPRREPTGPLPRAKLTSRLRAACLHWTGAGFDPLHGVSRLQPYRRAGPNQLRPALGGNQ